MTSDDIPEIDLDLTTIKAVGLGDAWFQCLAKALLEGRTYRIQQGSFAGTHRKEIPLVSVIIRHPGVRPLSPTVPMGVPAPTTDENIDEYMAYLMTDNKQPHELYTYGEDLAPQVDTVVERYKADGPECNQLCMSVGSRDSIDLQHSQCLRLVDTRIRYGKMHFITYFRSWDLWAGFPTNLGGLQLLKEYMAKEIGVEDGEMICLSKGLHLYEHAWDFAKSVGNLS